MANDISQPESVHPGGEIDFVLVTSDLTVSGSSGTPTLWIQGRAVTYNGTTRIKIEGSAALIGQGNSAIIVDLWDDTANVSLGRLMDAEGASADAHQKYNATFLTPVAGSRTYSLRAWKNGGTNGTIYGSTGLGSWYRITRA